MIKPAYGGGGKGMHLVHREEDLARGLEVARREAERAFGNGLIYLEKALLRPRHVEIQVLGDHDGNLVHLFERDCSIQRRHQKVLEETPSPCVSPELLRAMGDIALRGARAVGYHSAGTFEFLLADDDNFYFLEMNTRLQVEHAITEWVTGIDLVAEMLKIAAGEPLRFQQHEVVRRGASIECRIYAEDPAAHFAPSPGTLQRLSVPCGPWIRDDGGYLEGAEISGDYDPLISKVSVWAPDRPTAIARMRRALREYVALGIKTNLALQERLLTHPAFVAGKYHTGFLEEHATELAPGASESVVPHEALAAALAAAHYAASSSPPDTNVPPETRLSPWIHQHRSRLLG
jgi:acetyl-CoA carboxylase biotin carboxylase subunit